jgi:ribosomal protein S18 acetylase RimI-like enzyme
VDDIVIRDLQPADVETVVAIAVAAWAPIYAYYRQTMGDELFFTAFPDWPTEKARQVRVACNQERGAMVCVAETAGRVVGFVSFYAHPSRGIGEIGNNAVHPDWQGQGIAPRLYTHAFERLKALGMRFVQVGTGGDPAHAPARRAYEKAGFDIHLPNVVYYRKL